MLWIVTSEEPDDLLLMGRQRIDRMMNQTQADAHFDYSTIWRSKYHAITEEPEEIVNLTISHVAPQLRFDGTVESLPSGFTGQHLQRMRKLKPSAITLLEHLWMQRFDTV